MTKRMFRNVDALLRDAAVGKRELEGQTVYLAADVAAALGGNWDELKQKGELAHSLVGLGELREQALTLEGVLVLIQLVESEVAASLRRWLAKAGRERIEEAENPELAIARTQRAYQMKGYNPDWISKRLQSVGGRRALASEWYRRGVRESDDFRTLTNELVERGFGMDVNTYRRYKGLWRSGQNLRDHMTELELALVSLGETVAVNLHRERRSNGLEAVSADTRNAGEIVADTRQEIERQIGRSVVSALNHVDYSPRKPRSSHREAA